LPSHDRGDLYGATSDAGPSFHLGVDPVDLKPACGFVDAAYVRGTDITTIRAKGETFQIAPILVIGILNETGVQSVPQNVYFSVFKIDERMA
jgi:hypothetical protein